MSDAPSPHRLKKYSNRKLYDTYTRRYITLEDIARLVRDGGDVKVVQRDTGEDLTPAILSQIVAREERRGGNGHHDSAAEGIQERGQALLDYLRRTINMPAEIVTGEVEKRVGDVESLVDGALERALTRLDTPTRPPPAAPPPVLPRAWLLGKGAGGPPGPGRPGPPPSRPAGRARLLRKRV